jgi:hypothetical protein
MGDRANRISVATWMILIGGLCGWRSARLALGFAHDDAEYHFRQWQGRTDANWDSAELDRALALNPRHSAAWIARGLLEETGGDQSRAETTLLHLAQIDRTYLPRWTLASLYLRHGDLANFWIWARQAAEMAYDPAALFQLCWQASDDAREILERAIPPEPGIRRAYFDFLLRTKRLEAAQPLAEEIGRTAGLSDQARLLEYCDIEIARRLVKPALEVWNVLAARRVIPYGALDPKAGLSLTNGNFDAPPLMRGFDWSARRVEGASLSFDTSAHEMAVSFEGREAESCDFVEEYVPVLSEAPYRFRYRYRTRDLEAKTGLGFSVLDARTGGEFAASDIPASFGDWGETTILFSPPAGCDLLRILLHYRRPSGSVRAEGGAVFKQMTLALLADRSAESQSAVPAPGARSRLSHKWVRRSPFPPGPLKSVLAPGPAGRAN